MTNDHGWTHIGTVSIAAFDDGARLGPAIVQTAPILEDRFRCACRRTSCARRATEEDMLCDECRTDCPQPAAGDAVRYERKGNA